MIITNEKIENKESTKDIFVRVIKRFTDSIKMMKMSHIHIIQLAHKDVIIIMFVRNTTYDALIFVEILLDECSKHNTNSLLVATWTNEETKSSLKSE